MQTDELLKLLSPTAALAIVDDLAQATAEAENDSFPQRRCARQRVVRANRTQCRRQRVGECRFRPSKLLIAAVRGASDPNATFIMSKGTASYLGTLRGTGGAAAYPDVGPSGGRLLGLQVLISTAAEDSDSP